MRILRRIVIIFALVIVALLLSLFLNDKANQKVRITRYTHSDKEIPSVFDGCKIMMISDLHNADFSEDIIEHIKKEKPDYIFVAGDIVDSLDMIVKEEEKNRLINFIKDVANITKTIMILKY